MNNLITLTSVSQHLLVSLIPHSLITSHRLFRDPLNISHLLQELRGTVYENGRHYKAVNAKLLLNPSI